MIRNISIYGHYGSGNHGNEAIVRGIAELFPEKNITLYSYLPNTDYKFELNKLVNIKPFIDHSDANFLRRIIRGVKYRLKSIGKKTELYSIRSFIKNVKNDIYILEAGDQYCENDDIRSFYAYVNRQINLNGGVTIMLPCTIPVASLNNKELVDDLKRYKMIYARESITYEGLRNAGLTENTSFVPDTAFLMEPKECTLPDIFDSESVVGITIGALAQGKEKYSDCVYNSVKDLIKYLLNNTSLNMALIPHVNVGGNLNDLDALNDLFTYFKNPERVALIPEQRADEQKYVIGKCRFMITLRTHVSIAAYSQSIPTLVIGYSQKSLGIAKDLFSSYENFVVNVDTLEKKDTLIDAFNWLTANENEIKNLFAINLDSYMNKIKSIKKYIDSIVIEN